jgi:hypothetical protein
VGVGEAIWGGSEVPEGVEGVNRALGGAKTSEGVDKAEQAQPGGAGIVAGVGNVAPFVNLEGSMLSCCFALQDQKRCISCRAMQVSRIASLSLRHSCSLFRHRQ